MSDSKLALRDTLLVLVLSLVAIFALVLLVLALAMPPGCPDLDCPNCPQHPACPDVSLACPTVQIMSVCPQVQVTVVCPPLAPQTGAE